MDNVLNVMGKEIGTIGGADGPTSVIIAGKIGQTSMIILIVIGLLLCFLGLKVMKALVTLVGFCVGAGIGVGIGQTAGFSGLTNILVIFGCAIVLAAISYFVYRLGIFITAFIIISAVAFTIIDLNMNLQILIALGVALVLAILSMIFMEPAVILLTALSGGLFAGSSIVQLTGLSDSMIIKYGIGLILAVIGAMVQFMMHSRKVGKKEKLYSKKIKEKDSMESEVEKARMLLDEEDADSDSGESDAFEVIEENLEDDPEND
ncbi:MAG: hypothetical protein ACI4S2_15770 [Lachnospiraceae bacterium]